MVTTVALLALTSALASATEGQTPKWLTDYAQARQLAKEGHKPIAIFVGKGANGHEKVSRDGQLGTEIEQVLAEKYLCLYLDASQPAGRQLSGAFDITGGLGLVISDATGEFQAFQVEGDLVRSTLASYLRKYADPRRPVTTTESNSSSRVSYYPTPAAQPALPLYYPSSPVFRGSFGGGAGC